MNRLLIKSIAMYLMVMLYFYGNAQTDSSHYFVSFDSVRIYYEMKGNGKPVLLLHGFIVNGQSWKRTALYEDLLNKGYCVITPDLRGNGGSDKPHTPASYANDAEAKDMMTLVKALGINRYDLVGYSRGSIIAARLLVLDNRVGHAVIGGMGTDFTNPEWPRRKMFYRALMGDTVKELEPMLKYVKESGLDQTALAYLQKEQPATSKAALAAIKKRVMVICGSEDEDNGSALSLAKLIPDATYVSVPGNHNTALRSKEFSNAVLAFLKN
jgi:pimeloyl-ACP methyl ester carboxylesterase